MLKFFNAWTDSTKNLFLTRYELLQSDFFGELGRLASFIKCNLSPTHACQLQRELAFGI